MAATDRELVGKGRLLLFSPGKNPSLPKDEGTSKQGKKEKAGGNP